MKNLIRNLIKDKGLRIQHKSAGFTLIELLVVIAIIGILSSVVLVSLQSTRSKAKDSSAMISMSSISAAAELYYSNNSDYGTESVTSSSSTNGTLITGGGICGYDEVTKLMIAVSKQVPGTVTCKVGTGGQSYTVDTPLNTGNFCVDSNGFSGKGTASGNDNDVGVKCAPSS